MKALDILKLSYKSILRNKTNLINVFLLLIVSTGILFGFSVNKMLNQYWIDCTNNTVEYRTFNVYPSKNSSMSMDERIAKLKKYKNIVAIETADAMSVPVEVLGFKETKTKYLDVLGSIDTPVKIIKGESMKKYKAEENVLICPQKFYPYIDEKIEEFSEDRIIDLTNTVGKDIFLKPLAGNEKIKFKLVGIYDSELTNTRGDICYTKFSTVKKLNQKYQSDVYEETVNITLPNIVVIDNVRNNKSFMQDLAEDGIITNGPIKNITVDNGDKIMSIVSISSIILLFVSVIVNILLELKNYDLNQKEYGILKSMGYTSSDILKINDMRRAIITLISFVLSIIVGILALYIFQNEYLSNQILLKGIRIKISYSGLFFSLLINTIISIIVSIIIKRKIMRESTIKLLKQV